MSIEKGKLVCICTGILHFVIGVLLMLQPFSKEKYYLYITAIALLLGGFGSMWAFVVKSRSRFRPGWILPQGITGVLMGAIMFIGVLSGVSFDYSMLYNEFLAYFAIITAILHISASIQIKCLGFPRWWMMFTFGVIDLAYGVFAYFHMISAKECSFAAFGIFFVLLALQYVAETVSYKIEVRRDNAEFN